MFHNSKNLLRRQIHLLKKSKRENTFSISAMSLKCWTSDSVVPIALRVLHQMLKNHQDTIQYQTWQSQTMDVTHKSFPTKSPENTNTVQKQHCILRMKVQLPYSTCMAQERESDPKKIPRSSLEACIDHQLLAKALQPRAYLEPTEKTQPDSSQEHTNSKQPQSRANSGQTQGKNSILEIFNQ